MKLEIKKMTFDNFRGFTHKEVEFNGNTKVFGANAQGKTSIYFGWLWLMSGKSDALVDNPNVTPKGMSECETKVTAAITIDDKPCEVSKTQKYKEKTDDTGKTTSSVTNSYTINGVEKTLANFTADLKERGVDMDNFLILSSIFAFTADMSKKGREGMRKTLFEMVEGVTDLDIANTIDVPDVKAKLDEGYKIEEVEQMAKSNLKALNDRFGRDNEIINGRISGMISSKSTLDMKVLESQKAEYEAEIERIENELSHINDGKGDILKKLSKLKLQRDEIESKVTKETFKARADLEESMQVIRKEINDKTYEQHKAIDDIGRVEADIAETESNLEKQRTLYQYARDMVLGDDATRCPTCGREFEADKLSQIRADFDKNKADRIKTLKATGKTLKDKLEGLNNALADLKKSEKKIGGSLDDSRSKYVELETELSKLPDKSSVLTNNDEFAKINAEIAKIEEDLNRDEDSRIGELKSQLNVNKEMHHQILSDIGAVNHNKEIDAQIDALKEERKNAEIQRAQTEKLLNEVDVFKKHKNDKLSSEINKHFKIAQFRLFKTLRNGNIEDACDVLVNGKELNSQLNQSTQILALTDIIAGLQTFKKQFPPVFLDDHALFTAETDKMIPLECQVIKLIAADGVNELQIKED